MIFIAFVLFKPFSETLSWSIVNLEEATPIGIEVFHPRINVASENITFLYLSLH